MKQCNFGVCTSRSIIVTAPQKIDNVNSNTTFNQNCLFTLTIVLPLFMMYTQYTHFEATSFCIRVHSMVIVCVCFCVGCSKCSLQYTHESNLNKLKHPKWVTITISLLNAHLNVLQHEVK